MGWLAEKNQKQAFPLYQQTTFTSTYNVCMRNCTKISWRHIFEVIWGHLGTFEGSQLIRLIVVIIEDGGKSGDEPIILEPRMTPRPRLSRLVARLRNNPMRSKTLSRRPWPLIRSPGLTSTGVTSEVTIAQLHLEWNSNMFSHWDLEVT